MMNQYLSLGDYDIVEGMFWFEELPEEVTLGPIIVTNPAVTHGRDNCVVNPTPFPGAGWPIGPTPTSSLYWDGVGPNWVETSPETFADRKQKAIDKCFTDVDLVTEAAVGKRAREYHNAEVAARAYRAAGYTGTVSSYVSKYAKFNGTLIEQTNQWAADTIIARADAFAAAEEAMRDNRFEQQFYMMAATSDAELALPVARWDGFISYLRQQLGV